MNYLPYVNPLQGTDSVYTFSKGNTLPLVSRPWGMTSWSPQSSEEGVGWFFHPSHRRFEGIRLTHQPSPWMRDYGHLALMPQSGPLFLEATRRASSYRPDEMVVQPHYFRIQLPRYETVLELAPAMRSAALKLSFQRKEDCRLIISPFAGESSIVIDPVGRRVTGYTRAHHGEAHEHFAMYFVMEFDCPVDAGHSSLFYADFVPVGELEGTGERAGAFAALDVPDSGSVNVRIGTSFISLEQACLTLDREVGSKSFEQVVEEAAEDWEGRLSSIDVETDREDEKSTFYTCLYRTCLFPRTWHEYDGAGEQVHFSAYDGRVHSGPMYMDIGFWDVYRTSLPLYSLLFPSLLAEMTQAWVNIYKESSWMPKWISPAERSAMPGTLIDAAIADVFVKGIPGFDAITAYEGLRKHATTAASDGVNGRTGIGPYMEHGYLPDDQFHESVSNTLDYYYGDFCIAQIAKGLGKEEDYQQFLQRAAQYGKLFDPVTGFMRGRDEAGNFSTSFDPLEWGGPYCEGGAWQCSWAVPHDIAGLAKLMGGSTAFIQKLDELMEMPPLFKTGSYGAEIHEMSEMAAIDFGQFAISNQPSFHIPYLFTVLGQPSRTQYWVRKALNELFSSQPDGYPGDEDNGSLSSWYIWGALGLYPLCPGVPEYVIGSPLFNKATIRLEDGEQLVVEAVNNNPEHVYWDTLTINGEPYTRLFVTHEQLAKGADLQFHMTRLPTEGQYDRDSLPYSLESREADERK